MADSMTRAVDSNGRGVRVEGRGVGVGAGSAIPDSGGTHQYNATAGSGSTLTDVIGSLDGTINGASWQTGGNGAGDAYLSYDGNDDYVDLGSASQTEFNHWLSGNGTVGAWIKVPDNNENYAIMGAGGYSDANSFILINNKGNYNVRFGPSGNTDLSSSGSVPTNKWAFVAVTADGSNVHMYYATAASSSLNSDSASVSSTANNDLDTNMTIGKEINRWYWPGDIDIVFFDNVAQTQSELQSFVDDTKQFYQ